MNITPEEKAREFIDQWFDIAGWEVVDRDQITNDLQAIAVREGLMENNLEADYVLFLGGRAVGVLEAKRVEVDVLSPEVQQQALNYTHKAPSWVKVYENPLPIVYVSNGKDLYYLNQNAQDYNPAELLARDKVGMDITWIHQESDLDSDASVEDLLATIDVRSKDIASAIANLKQALQD